ncbi:MAG: hypothetical protein ACOC6H_03710 [Thermoproteota archaeon]
MAKVDVVGRTESPREHVREAVIRAVEVRLKEVQSSLRKVEKRLKGFEEEYQMTTEDFYSKYVGHKLEENMDFMEWRACKEISDDLQEEMELLREIFSS